MTNFAGFAVKCGRCGTVFTTPNCAKLDHFGIYRVTCPECQWPGRYLASELRPVKLPAAAGRARPAAKAGSAPPPKAAAAPAGRRKS